MSVGKERPKSWTVYPDDELEDLLDEWMKNNSRRSRNESIVVLLKDILYRERETPTDWKGVKS